MKTNCLLLCLFAVVNLAAQQVETLVSHPKILDGLHVDSAGYIYTTPGGLVGGNAIGRATPQGDFDPNFAPGFNGPIDIDQDANGILYITNYDNNTLKTYHPSTQQVSILATGLDGPAGVVLDASGNVYVTCFGAPPTYNGRRVMRITPTGESEVWLETTEFFRPQGMDFDDEGNLWIANTPSGNIFRVDTITKIPELVLDYEGKVGNMTFRSKDQKLYFPSENCQCILRMDLQGNLDTLAGSGGTGGTDGDAMQAQFNKPLGIAFTASEDTLYIAEAGARRLRRIVMNTPNAIAPVATDDFQVELLNNPVHDQLIAIFDLPDAQTVHCQIIDTNGAIRLHSKPKLISTGQMEFQLTDLPAGIYYLLVKMRTHQISKRFLKIN